MAPLLDFVAAAHLHNPMKLLMLQQSPNTDPSVSSWRAPNAMWSTYGFSILLASFSISMLHAFEHNVAPGGSLIVLSSMGAHTLYLFPSPDAEEEHTLAISPAQALSQDSQYKAFNASITDKGHAYCYTKIADNLRIEDKAVPYAQKGASINSVSLG
ncbi:hypothetical protein AC579_5452 [Pseudocercospora musae]|uniref:Uncharacterized protein n=1 Tax=Pseudocercospora musae TaxID=113226 RepID=A0A139HJP4_9PEZI|nr:hypothetical protein AC579_5452 [Pseudocercospora musae]